MTKTLCYYYPYVTDGFEEEHEWGGKMSHICVSCNNLAAPPALELPFTTRRSIPQRQGTITAFAAKSGGFSLNSVCSWAYLTRIINALLLEVSAPAQYIILYCISMSFISDLRQLIFFIWNEAYILTFCSLKMDLQILRSCQTCGGKGAIECPGCKVIHIL